MGGGACPELWLGLRQGDVEALLALFRSLQKEAKRHGGFPGAWISLEQKHVSPRKPAGENVIETRDPGAGFALSEGGLVHHFLRPLRR